MQVEIAIDLQAILNLLFVTVWAFAGLYVFEYVQLSRKRRRR